MAIAINGSGTVTGISVGGLPDGIVDAGTLASNSVETAKINAEAVTNVKHGPGSVIQVVRSTASQSQGRTSHNTTTFNSGGLSCPFTPINSDSLIYVSGYIMTYIDTGNTYGEYTVSPDNTAGNADTDQSVWYGAVSDTERWGIVSFAYSHTSGSTNARTYGLRIKRHSGSGIVYTGWSSSPSNMYNGGNMMVMEVVA